MKCKNFQQKIGSRSSKNDKILQKITRVCGCSRGCVGVCVCVPVSAAVGVGVGVFRCGRAWASASVRAWAGAGPWASAWVLVCMWVFVGVCGCLWVSVCGCGCVGGVWVCVRAGVAVGTGAGASRCGSGLRSVGRVWAWAGVWACSAESLNSLKSVEIHTCCEQ